MLRTKVFDAISFMTSNGNSNFRTVAFMAKATPIMEFNNSSSVSNPVSLEAHWPIWDTKLSLEVPSN